MNFFKRHSTKIAVFIVNGLLITTGAMAISDHQEKKKNLVAMNNQPIKPLSNSETPVIKSDVVVPVEITDAAPQPALEPTDVKDAAASVPKPITVSKSTVSTAKPKTSTSKSTKTSTTTATATAPKIVAAPVPAPVVAPAPTPTPTPVAKTKTS